MITPGSPGCFPVSSLAQRCQVTRALVVLSGWNCGRCGRSNQDLITHNPHPVRSPSRKATRWDRKRLLNRFESGTKRRAGRQISAERLRCSSNMSFGRNQEGSCPYGNSPLAVTLPTSIPFLITSESHVPAAGPRWQGFRRLRDDLSGWIDRRFPLSNYPPTAIDHRVRARGEDCA